MPMDRATTVNGPVRVAEPVGADAAFRRELWGWSALAVGALAIAGVFAFLLAISRIPGIETVFQTLALADHLDVPDNLFLGREKILVRLGPFSNLDYKGMREATLRGLEKTGVKIPAGTRLEQFRAPDGFRLAAGPLRSRSSVFGSRSS